MIIIMEICKVPTLRLKALNKHDITHMMYIEMEMLSAVKKNICRKANITGVFPSCYSQMVVPVVLVKAEMKKVTDIMMSVFAVADVTMLVFVVADIMMWVFVCCKYHDVSVCCCRYRDVSVCCCRYAVSVCCYRDHDVSDCVLLRIS